VGRAAPPAPAAAAELGVANPAGGAAALLVGLALEGGIVHISNDLQPSTPAAVVTKSEADVLQFTQSLGVVAELVTCWQQDLQRVWHRQFTQCYDRWVGGRLPAAQYWDGGEATAA
jgi:hypothetical protein